MKIITKSLKNALLIIPLIAMGFAVFSTNTPASALDWNSCKCGAADQVLSIECGTVCAGPRDPNDATCLFGINPTTGEKCLFNKIIDTALFLIGAISVIMLIYGGIRYTLSGGKPEAVTNAKNTILYAIVGIVVALLAYAIIDFVVGVLAPGTP